MLPSNEGRGYVLRRIMRRAIRFGRLLNLPSPFLGKVSERVVELMGEVYPELVEARRILAQVVTGEEERFADTLDHGLKLLERGTGYLKTHSLKILPGEVAFKLYDTYGFPLDLVQDSLREEDLVLDLEGFEDTHAPPAGGLPPVLAGRGRGRGAAGLPGTGPMAPHPLPGLRSPGGRQHHPGPHYPRRAP